MRIVRVATIPFVVLHHLEGQIRASVAAGHEVYVVTMQGAEVERIRALGVAGVVCVDIPREISPLADLVALCGLWRAFGRLKPDLVHSITPKAGLLAAIAGWLRGVPIRLHTFTGQAWAVRSGLVRWLSRMADRLVVRLNTRCYADSFSQRDFLVAEGICRLGELQVLGSGSLAGVDLKRFDAERLRDAAAHARARLRVSAGRKLIAFVGRVTRDKGVGELVAAFKGLRDASLVLVGPLEPERDPLAPETLSEIERNPAIHAIGYDPEPERYLAAADLLCLPSYREGFGIVVLEAAALGVPCVGTRITGLADAVVDGVTGVLVPPKDAGALRMALEGLLADDARRRALGDAARVRVRREFDAAAMQAGLLAEYAALESVTLGGDEHRDR
ncbi:MAG TPA: glycosyltransferase family 4 protein [Burkholderiales bacterium]|nr:glycosyltransferase family 4 protein [Burkholderiales bacterium]